MNKSILCLGFSLYAVLGCAQNEQKLVFDFASPRQTIHSFGASDCWRVQYIGKNWPLENGIRLQICCSVQSLIHGEIRKESDFPCGALILVREAMKLGIMEE